MGHFSQTCLLSHLPITGGTPIRVCLLCSTSRRGGREGRWTFWSIPFRAEYNDYGSIQNVHPDDQVLVDLAIAQLNQDAVEIPQGDNPYHDPPVTRGMPAEGWWDALWEGRLQVWDTYGTRLKVTVPKGVPTWRRVKKFLDGKTAKGKLPPGSVVNRIAYGLVKVIYHGDWEQRYAWYTAVRSLLERKYRVTERYEYGPKHHQEMVAAAEKLGEDPKVRASLDVWFEVAPKDGEYPPTNPARKKIDDILLRQLELGRNTTLSFVNKCDITWAFIREDAWQATLPLGGPEYYWGNSPTVQGTREKFMSCLTRILKTEEVHNRILALGDLRKARPILDEIRAEDPEFSIFDVPSAILRDAFALDHFVPGGGISGELTILNQWRASGNITPSQLDAVVQAFAEHTVVSFIMNTVCITPIPTHGGPQDGAWEAHKAFHNAMTPVVLNGNPRPPEEGEESDGEGESDAEPQDLPESSVSDEESTYSDVDIEHD